MIGFFNSSTRMRSQVGIISRHFA
uniref:Uncharacterized protein n=1 Tax=Arundo donax TaxID=35708 RepID=A0A0A9H7A7_ARUDO